MKPDHRRYVLLDPFPFFAASLTLDEKLAKRISATCSTTLADPTRCIESFTTKLIHVGALFSNLIQTLEVSINYEECFRIVYQVLKNCCPNLKQFRITVFLPESRNFIENPIAASESLSVSKSNLTLFAVRSNLATPCLSDLIQLVINASPNLKELLIPLDSIQTWPILNFWAP